MVEVEFALSENMVLRLILEARTSFLSTHAEIAFAVVVFKVVECMVLSEAYDIIS